MAGAVCETWVLASGNQGKLEEFRALFAEAGLRFRALGEFDIAGPDETGTTFIENALIKARHAARLTGLPAIADDSGLVVDALGGLPGVRSARFAGPGATDRENLELLLAELRAVPHGSRGARFHCVIVALRDATEPAPLIGQGTWEGAIALAPRGTGGFGYDPVFVDADSGNTAAELSPAVKNEISHRARALRALQGQLASRWA